jgi:predicted RNA binding protein YcfA (HicA-like mRNA interferase family)
VSQWPSTKARQVLRALQKIGWEIKATKASSHIQLVHPDRGDYTWAFRDSDELGPIMLSKIAKKTGLKREDL